jgi:hypothetical protein
MTLPVTWFILTKSNGYKVLVFDPFVFKFFLTKFNSS